MSTWRRSFPLPTDKPSRRPPPRPKQLYDILTQAEVDKMTPKERQDRLSLCQHQLTNKEGALTMFNNSGIKVKDYMYAEVDGLRFNIELLKKS